MATSWKFYLNVKDAWDSMYEDLESAKNTIDIEQYIFYYQPTTERFFNLLKKKVSEGVKVRLICDMIGSYRLYESPEARDLEESGIDFEFFNPVSMWRSFNLAGWLFRDHRKLLIVDDTIAHTGGVGFNGDMKRWRDTNIRIVGPVVKNMKKEFERIWESEKKRKFTKRKKKQDFADDFAFFTNSPQLRERVLYKQVTNAIAKAKNYAYITTPYFIPTIRLFRKLRHSAKKGADVRILVPKYSDSKIVDFATHSFFGMAMKSGIRVFEYTENLIHSKTVVVDDEWATVGSMNLDSQSIIFNHEANLVTINKECVMELKSHFMKDLEVAKEVNRKEWEGRPIKNRIKEALTWPIHIFL